MQQYQRNCVDWESWWESWVFGSQYGVSGSDQISPPGLLPETLEGVLEVSGEYIEAEIERLKKLILNSLEDELEEILYDADDKFWDDSSKTEDKVE